MHVRIPKRSSHVGPDVEKVSLEDLFSSSDFISLHAPLTTETRDLINADSISIMKSSALLINTGRGGLINESDLREGLLRGQIAGAALDVLSLEPPTDKNPLIMTKNVLVTPHMAWRSKEAREALIRIVSENIVNFSNDIPSNRLV
jgi:glycerate dehydrogenase